MLLNDLAPGVFDRVHPSSSTVRHLLQGDTEPFFSNSTCETA